jgi:threonine dehydrogenase-like Zn-dependent dehydrogenase
LHQTAIWVGGSSVTRGEALLQAVVGSFFGPFRVSAIMDANGCNTTAAATVARLAGVMSLKTARTVILAGTGPVGLRAAVLLAREGASVVLTSRSLERARAASADLRARFDVTVEPREVVDAAGVARALDGATVCVTAGAAGATLLPRAVWESHPTLKAMADVNAVPPLGIEGIEAGDKGNERASKVVFGALGIGSLKMKVHRACVARLFERNDEILDIDTIYSMARGL